MKVSSASPSIFSGGSTNVVIVLASSFSMNKSVAGPDDDASIANPLLIEHEVCCLEI